MNDRDFLGSGLALPGAVCHALFHDLPRTVGFSESMTIIDDARQQLIGPGLLTVNLRCETEASPESGTIELQRIWTSDPVAYPVAGRKRKRLTPWTEQLLIRGEVFVGEGRDVLATVFEDHALISSLGLQSVINVPMFDDAGRGMATFNVLAMQPHWSESALQAAQFLAVLCASRLTSAGRK